MWPEKILSNSVFCLKEEEEIEKSLMGVLYPWVDYMLFWWVLIYKWCNAPLASFFALLPLVYVALKAQLLTHRYFVD